MVTRGAKAGQAKVELTITGMQARQLARAGHQAAAQEGRRPDRRAAVGPRCRRPCSARTAARATSARSCSRSPADHPAHRAGRRRSARSVQGKPITAVRVSKDVAKLKDRKRPAVVYQAAQHAREWITPEMVRRLLHHYVDGYGTDARADEDHRHHRPVVHPGGQRGRLRLHVHRGQPAVAQEPARQRRRRPDHRRRTASTSTATSPTSGATTTRAPRTSSPARPTAARRRGPSRRRRRRSGCTTGSGPSTRSTGTRPPSCCCTASAGRRSPRARTT